MLPLKPCCFTPWLKAFAPRAAQTATFAVQVTLISMGLASAGELLGILPVWLRSLVSGRAAIEEENGINA